MAISDRVSFERGVERDLVVSSGVARIPEKRGAITYTCNAELGLIRGRCSRQRRDS